MSNTLSVIKSRDFIQILDRASAEDRLCEPAPERNFLGDSMSSAIVEPTHVTLTFEVLGLPVGKASLPVIGRSPLTELTSAAFADLPPLHSQVGYYFPSALVPDSTPPSAPDGYFFVERARYPRYFLDLNQTFDDFMATKSGKTRSTLRRKVRKFAEVSGGAVDWRLYRTPDELAEFHRLAIALARRTYQARLYDAALPEDEEFYREMMTLATNGQVAAFLLFLDGTPIAYLYAPIVGRRIMYGFLGFDADHARLSPGTVLQLHAMEWCFDQDDLEVFDFTEGEGPHKALFSTCSRSCCDLIVLRKRPTLRLIVALYSLSRTLSRAFYGLLDRLGLRMRLRQWLRRSG